MPADEALAYSHPQPDKDEASNQKYLLMGGWNEMASHPPARKSGFGIV
ncbi:hypothetical protein ACFV4F_27135 [Kitasatospora sp. NPDC059722]